MRSTGKRIEQIAFSDIIHDVVKEGTKLSTQQAGSPNPLLAAQAFVRSSSELIKTTDLIQNLRVGLEPLCSRTQRFWRSSAAFFWSSMSVQVPNHLTISPASIAYRGSAGLEPAIVSVVPAQPVLEVVSSQTRYCGHPRLPW